MDRYTQQSMLPDVGKSGQERIKKTAVVIIGAGGLGTPLASYLGAMGIGNLAIVDFDTIQTTNLHRQFQYRENQIGHQKATTLAKVVSEQNNAIAVTPIDIRLDSENVKNIITAYNIVCDCTDNAEARILINHACKEEGKPLVYGAVRDWQGYVSILYGKKGISLTDVFSNEGLLLATADNCSFAGVAPPVCGIVGSYMANEVMKLALEIESKLDGAVLCLDTLMCIHKIFHLQPSTESCDQLEQTGLKRHR